MNGKALDYGENVVCEAGKYRSCLQRRIMVEEQAPEKIRADCLSTWRHVPETDTGGRVENTEARERFTVKELGKLAP